MNQISSETIYNLTDINLLIARVRTRQLKFLVHVLRMPEVEPVKEYALNVSPHGKKNSVRPHKPDLQNVLRLLTDIKRMLQPSQIGVGESFGRLVRSRPPTFEVEFLVWTWEDYSSVCNK